jgi:hypothetical protein
MKPNETQPSGFRTTHAMLILLGLSLTGCATHSVQPQPPQLPARPSLTVPQPLTTYSDSVQKLLQTWREKLTATQATR